MINLLDLIYPNVCGICKKISKENICIKCRQKLKKIERSKISKCNGAYFDKMAYVFNYEGIIRERLIEYKFNEGGYLYKTFSEILIKNEKISRFIKKYDIIIPVPVHRERKKQRGYNQTELIAKKIATQLEIKLELDILIKVKNIKPQSTLDKENRKMNIQNVYKLQNAEKIKGKKVLLLDDIYTTGSTINECSRMLNLAKPMKIGALTIAKD